MYKSGTGTVTVSDKTMSETTAGILNLPIRRSLIGFQTRLIVVLSMGLPAVTSLLIHLLTNSLHSYPQKQSAEAVVTICVCIRCMQYVVYGPVHCLTDLHGLFLSGALLGDLDPVDLTLRTLGALVG